MANFYISEYRELPIAGAPIPPAYVIARQKFTTSASSQQSNPFNIQTRYIRVFSDDRVNFVVGADPVATDIDTPLAKEGSDFFAVIPGDKIAAIDRV